MWKKLAVVILGLVFGYWLIDDFNAGKLYHENKLIDDFDPGKLYHEYWLIQ